MPSASSSSGPASKLIIEDVRPDCREEYEAWAEDITAAAAEFDGYLGVEVFAPDPGDHRFVTVLRFDSDVHLAAWNESGVFRTWLAEADDLITGSEVRRGSGVDLWFHSPADPVPAPALWKSIIVASVLVYGLLLFLRVVLDPFVEGLPSLLSLAISVFILNVILTAWAFPLSNRVLQSWLYPDSSD